jgi:hypothetical protein
MLGMGKYRTVRIYTDDYSKVKQVADLANVTIAEAMKLLLNRSRPGASAEPATKQ